MSNFKQDVTIRASKTILITGGSSGLGLETAKVLAQFSENHLILASRNPKQAAAELRRTSGNQTIEGIVLDLGSFDSVRTVAAEIRNRQLPPLYAIVCNAGMSIAGPTRYSADGYEATFAVNHLGHFLLVNELRPLLARPARVVVVSSGTHIPEHKLARRLGTPEPKYTSAQALALGDKAPEAKRLTNQTLRYTTSKLCNVLFAYELARQLDDSEVGVFAIDPGLMPDTNLMRDLPSAARMVIKPILSLALPFVAGMRWSEQSAKDMARLVTDPVLTGRTALYFDGHEETKSSADSYDLTKANDLWETSLQLVAGQP